MLEDRNVYDVAAVWCYFLEEFKAQFQDTQLTTRARQKVRTLKMQWPHIDQYIRDFEALVRAAKYDMDNPETVDLFIEGLSPSIRKDVFAPPMPTTYRAIKRKAIEATASSRFLDELAKKEQQRRAAPQGSPWQNFQQGQRGNTPEACQLGKPNPKTASKFAASSRGLEALRAVAHASAERKTLSGCPSVSGTRLVPFAKSAWTCGGVGSARSGYGRSKRWRPCTPLRGV
jgi:hypothetical protein